MGEQDSALLCTVRFTEGHMTLVLTIRIVLLVALVLVVIGDYLHQCVESHRSMYTSLPILLVHLTT